MPKGYRGHTFAEIANSLEYGDFNSMRDVLRAMGAAVDKLQNPLVGTERATDAAAQKTNQDDS